MAAAILDHHAVRWLGVLLPRCPARRHLGQRLPERPNHRRWRVQGPRAPLLYRGRDGRSPLLSVVPPRAQDEARSSKPETTRDAREGGDTPPCAGWFFGNNFRSAPFACTKRRAYLQTNNTKPPPAGFGGAVRRSRAITQHTKNMPFLLCVFSTYSQNTQMAPTNGAISVNIVLRQ